MMTDNDLDVSFLLAHYSIPDGANMFGNHANMISNLGYCKGCLQTYRYDFYWP